MIAGIATGVGLAGCAGAPPQIVSLDPINGRGDVPVDFSIGVAFDHAVDRSSVATRFHLDPALGGCDIATAFRAPQPGCRIVWTPDSMAFHLEHSRSLFTPGTTYHLSLDSGVADSAGVVNGLDHRWAMTTAAAPSVLGITPSDGATDVDVSSELVVTFATPMQAVPTAAAISLSPASPGTRVVANSRDPSRFVVLPGRLLAARTAYTLSVRTSAVGDHGARLLAPAAARFVTGGLGVTRRALVLGRRRGESPTLVELTGVGSALAGDPAPAATLLEAPRCASLRCGDSGTNDPLETYLAAALAPDASSLALVVRDQTRLASAPNLELVALPGLERSVIGFGGGMPSWSPRGDLLAFSSGAQTLLWDAHSGRTRALPPGDPLDAPPTWTADGSMLALQVRAPGGTPHVDLADPRLLLRYPVPAIADPASAPALNPDGSVLALRVEGARPGTVLVHLRTAAAAPQRAGDDLTPLAWTAPGTLLLVERPAAGDPGLVRLGVAGGELDRLAGGPAAGYLSTVSSDAAGRSLGYLLADVRGIVQAWAENADGTNGVQLTGFAPESGYEAFSISFAG